MCYLKTLKPLQEISLKSKSTLEITTSDSQELVNQEKYISTNIFQKTNKPLLLSKQQEMIQNILRLVSFNSSSLMTVQNKLFQSQSKLKNVVEQLYQTTPLHSSSVSLQNYSIKLQTDIFDDQQIQTTQPIIQKLFGKHKYEYKLQLTDQFPTVIYKQRNINVGVKLINNDSQTVLNSNIIHLCLAVCDANGEWITQNKVGQNFMKGKTQVQLYHGEASFLKIYPRDVSRGYLQGKINFVVYSKPSTVKFTTYANSLQKIVQSDLIEPLLIKDITIRAKKKD